MLDKNNDPVEWGTWLYEFTDAIEHLENLTDEIGENDELCEESLRIGLGHIYSHLNRAWNSRDHRGEITEEKWTAFSNFPKDLDWT
jgi:hypothetical protein